MGNLDAIGCACLFDSQCNRENLIPLQSLGKWSLLRVQRPSSSPAASILEVLDDDSSTLRTISSSLRQET